MHPWDKKTSVGRTADLLPFRRGKERGRARSEAVSSSLVHAFPPVKTLRKGQRRVDHNAPARLIFGLHTSPLPLHYPTSCLCCFLPLLPPLFFLFHSSVVQLISPPSVRPLLAVFSFFFSPVIIFSASDELEGQVSPPPPRWTRGCQTVVSIFF